jgi:hypothetical protein
MRHLLAAKGLHENDMSILKRLKPRGLRHGVPKGRRVLIVYDKAGIDFWFLGSLPQGVRGLFPEPPQGGDGFWLAGGPRDQPGRFAEHGRDAGRGGAHT